MESARTIEWSYLARVGYRASTELQERVRQAVRDGRRPDCLLLLEHPHVYTLGRSASEADVLADRRWLEGRGIEIVETDRGGQVTYHGPGQLVGYPILDLNPDRRDVRRYVRDLQEVLVRTLSDFGVEAQAETRRSLIGVWARGEKIASIGVHLSRWITTHGFALNVTTDLAYFREIVPCGLPSVRMASVETLTGRRPPLGEVADAVAEYFGHVFDRQPIEVEPTSLMAAPASEDSEAPADRRAGVSGVVDGRELSMRMRPDA